MKTQNALFTAGTLLVLLVRSFGQPAEVDSEIPMPGTPGVATRQAVMNFAELARRGALARARNLSGEMASRPEDPARVGPILGPSDGPLGPVTDSPAPASSFLALLGEGELKDKPDTQGAVGPNHLMVALNTSVRIQDRSGGVISTVSLSNFWSSLGPFNVQFFEGELWDGAGIFDPKLLYDPYAKRFIFVTLADEHSATSSLLIGASRTSDPTGDWNLYRFDADAGNQSFIDYPFIGLNKDWIAVQTIMFNISRNGFSRVHIYVFNKTNLYTGGDGAFTLFSRSDIGFFQTPAVTFDTNLSTLYLMQQLGEHNRTSLDSLRIFTITGPVGSEVFTIGPTVVSTNRWAFNAPSGFNSNFSPQLGSANKIYSKGANLQTLVYRNGSLWAAQTIYLPAGDAVKRSSIQWWQISPQGQIIQRGLIDDPTGVEFFAFPSLAVNQFNDVLIGYNRYSSNQYASANYAFRAGNDPPNTLRADTVLKAGEAPVDFTFPSYPLTGWGDYSATMVDPVNDLDLWTIQEYASTNIGGFGGGDNWGTWWGQIVPPPSSGLFIADTAIEEGDTGTTDASFTVLLPGPTDQMISVDFATEDGSAIAGIDYVATNGTLIFNPGESKKAINVPVITDLLRETNKNFFVQLTNATNVVLTHTQARGTILDDDTPSVSINDISVIESHAGTTGALFTLSLSKAVGQSVSVRCTTQNRSASAVSDFVFTNLVLTFPVGITTQTLSILVYGDTLSETNETFVVNLTSPTNAAVGRTPGVCTILDDDFQIAAVEILGSDVRISFSTIAGRSYRVEWTDDLTTPIVWGSLVGAESVAGTGAMVEVIDAGAANQSQRFYQVTLLP